MKYFCYLGCSILTEEIAALVPELETIIDLQLMPAGFHEQPTRFQQLLQSEIDRIEDWSERKRLSPENNREYEAILLGFGLCSKATEGLTTRKYTLVIPRAHDCITLLLGSKERYQEYFQNTDGNFWYSAGWIKRMLPPGPDRTKLLKQNYLPKYGPENTQYLLETELEWQSHYQQATFINWDLAGTGKLQEYTRACACSLNWQYQELHGDPTLLRDFLNGNWDEERFLILKPGEVIVPSYDQRVLTSKTLPD